MPRFPLFRRTDSLGTAYYCNQCRVVKALIEAGFHADDQRSRKTLTNVVSGGYCPACRSKLEHARVFEGYHRGRLAYLVALLGGFLLMLLGIFLAPTEKLSDLFMIWTGVVGLVLLIHVLIMIGLLMNGRNWVIRARLENPPAWPAERFVDQLVRELRSTQ